MPSLNKRGLSQIITTVILIGLVLIAISLIWVFVSGLIQKSALLSPENSCIAPIPTLEILKACYNPSTSELEVVVSNNFEDKIAQFYFLVDANEPLTFCCGVDCPGCKTPENSKRYYLSLSEKPKDVSLKLKSCVFREVKVWDC